MGNKHSQPQFTTLLKTLKNQKLSPKRLSIRPQQKYLQMMIQGIEKCTCPYILKYNLLDFLLNNINRVQLIQTVQVINGLQRNSLSPPTLKSNKTQTDAKQSKHVIINFNSQKLKKYFKKPQKQIKQSTLKSPALQTQKIKKFQNIIRIQIKKQNHPFNKMIKIFSQYLAQVFLTYYNQQQIQKYYDQNQPNIQKFFKDKFLNKKDSKFGVDQNQYQDIIRKLLHKFSISMAQSCLKPYRKWVLTYSQLPQNKYNKWITNIIYQQIWIVNQGYLYQIITLIIQNHKSKLHIPLHLKQSLITPQLFKIDKPLQIQGSYFHSIHTISQFPNINRPSQIFKKLLSIKISICNDIDYYYKLQQKNKQNNIHQQIKPSYQINGDDILGITAYIIYTIKQKIQQIDRQCIFLRILYGDSVYYTYGQSSYMLSTIVAAIQFLNSQTFIDIVRDNLKNQIDQFKLIADNSNNSSSFNQQFKNSVNLNKSISHSHIYQQKQLPNYLQNNKKQNKEQNIKQYKQSINTQNKQSTIDLQQTIQNWSLSNDHKQ